MAAQFLESAFQEWSELQQVDDRGNILPLLPSSFPQPKSTFPSRTINGKAGFYIKDLACPVVEVQRLLPSPIPSSLTLDSILGRQQWRRRTWRCAPLGTLLPALQPPWLFADHLDTTLEPYVVL